MRPLRVLLWSPLRGIDPVSGDTSFTEALLADPPPGVEYTTYRQAIEDGTVRVRGRKPWHSRPEAIDMGIFLARSAELAARRAGLMFREYISYVSIEPSAFDLVHQHLAAIRQVGRRLPVVSGAGYPLPELYRAREQWGETRLSVALALEGWLVRWADVHNPWLRATDGNIMTVYTDHFRDWLVGRGVEPGRIRVVSTALPQLALPAKRSDGRTLGIIARDWYRKGGDIAVEAFQLLRARDPSWHLLVGCPEGPAASLAVRHDGVDVVANPDRATVLYELLPRIDVLLAPTRSDCGVPYTLLEALQAGVAVVTSDVAWLDDRLAPPAVRRVPCRASAVADAVAEMSAGDMATTSFAAQELWRTTFSMRQLHRSLLEAYSDVLDRGCRSEVDRSLLPKRVLVVARPYDLSDAPFDGFVTRHRRMVSELCKYFEVVVLYLRANLTDEATVVIAGPTSYLEVELPQRQTSRRARLMSAVREAVGIETREDIRLAEVASRARPDVVVTVGPWLHDQYRALWRRYPSVHLYEEDLCRMSEIAPQSTQARAFRRIEELLRACSGAQPITVISISPTELRRAERRFPSAVHAYVPFTLDPREWPGATCTSNGSWLIAVGNFAELRNAEGLADVVAEIARRHDTAGIRLKIVSGPGLHPMLHRYLDMRWIHVAQTVSAPRDEYAEAWAALVPGRRVSGQKTTILQAWACRVPVVCSMEAAATVEAGEAVLTGPDARTLVDHIVRLRGDPEARDVLAAAGAQRLSRDFNPDMEPTTLRDLVTSTKDRTTRSWRTQ